MEGVGAILLVFAGWMAYCALHSFRPINMGRALLTDPSQAANTIRQAETEVKSTAASGDNNSLGDGALKGFTDTFGASDQSPTAPTTQGSAGSSVQSYQQYANQLGQQMWGGAWNATEMNDLIMLWNRESGWNPQAYNSSSGATGIPQSLPGDKMASAGADWKTNPATQITWGLGYIKQRYGSPSAAWAHEQSAGWY